MDCGAITGPVIPETSTNKRVPYTGDRLPRYAYANIVLDELQGEKAANGFWTILIFSSFYTQLLVLRYCMLSAVHRNFGTSSQVPRADCLINFNL